MVLLDVNALRLFICLFFPYSLLVFVIFNLEYDSGLSNFFGFIILVSILDLLLT